MRNYKQLKENAQLLRDKTNFTVNQIAEFLGVARSFIQRHTEDNVLKDIRIIEDWVCEYDDIGLLAIKYKKSHAYIQKVIDKYLGKNENNFVSLKSKV